MGSLHFLKMFFDRDFLGTPLNRLLSSQKCQGLLFPQFVKIYYVCMHIYIYTYTYIYVNIHLCVYTYIYIYITFAEAPLVLTPFVRNQRRARRKQRDPNPEDQIP